MTVPTSRAPSRVPSDGAAAAQDAGPADDDGRDDLQLQAVADVLLHQAAGADQGQAASPTKQRR